MCRKRMKYRGVWNDKNAVYGSGYRIPMNVTSRLWWLSSSSLLNEIRSRRLDRSIPNEFFETWIRDNDWLASWWSSSVRLTDSSSVNSQISWRGFENEKGPKSSIKREGKKRDRHFQPRRMEDPSYLFDASCSCIKNILRTEGGFFYRSADPRLFRLENKRSLSIVIRLKSYLNNWTAAWQTVHHFLPTGVRLLWKRGLYFFVQTSMLLGLRETSSKKRSLINRRNQSLALDVHILPIEWIRRRFIAQ